MKGEQEIREIWRSPEKLILNAPKPVVVYVRALPRGHSVGNR
jgi:hypothetical protein